MKININNYNHIIKNYYNKKSNNHKNQFMRQHKELKPKKMK